MFNFCWTPFLLNTIKFAELLDEVWVCAQLYPTLYDPMDCSRPCFSVHGIFQARITEWLAIIYPSRVSCIGMADASPARTHTERGAAGSVRERKAHDGESPVLGRTALSGEDTSTSDERSKRPPCGGPKACFSLCTLSIIHFQNFFSFCLRPATATTDTLQTY